ncbi:MAG TPA: cytosine permease [Dehalococcoidia bacterium]|nr:cytosine permease [Dehalococcoidia bacterium]
MERGAPAGERTFGTLDHAVLWGSIGVSLYVMPFGSLLVPSLSIEQAFLAVVVAMLLGALLLAAVAAVAARSGLSTVELLARVFGERATPLVAVLLLVRNVAWAAFALSLIAGAAELVSERALGAGLRPLWVIAFGLAGAALAAAGPEFTVRKLLRRAGLWLVLLVAAVITLSAYMQFEVPTYLKRPAVGGWPSFWQAVDVMLIVPLLWLPLVADYARRGKDAAGAFVGSFAGFFVASVWLGFLGVVYLPAVETADISGFVVGMKLGLGALVILLLLQTDEVFAGVHSAGLALRTLVPLGRREGAIALSFLVIALTLPFDLLQAEGWLLLLASLFVPLFGVLLADQLGREPGRAADAPSALAAWAAGFLLYHWISPADLGWWRDAMDWVFAHELGLPFPLTDEVTWLGAAIPSLLGGFTLHLVGRAALAWWRRRLEAVAVAAS